MSDDNFDTLLNELSSFEIPANQVSSQSTAVSNKLEEANVSQYVLDKSKAIIDAGVGAVQDMTPYIVQGQDAREIEALSKLVAATAQALDTLNKKTLIDKKAEKDEQLERIKIDARKEIAQLQGSNKNVTNNNLLIASREEIMKQLFKENKGQVLEIEDK